MDLIEKLKESRRHNINAGGHTFKFNRPTAADMERYHVGWPSRDITVQVTDSQGNRLPLSQTDLDILMARDRYNREQLLPLVCDWPGMREMDILPGGTGAPVPFDLDLFLVWVSDQPNIAETLANAIRQSWIDHNAAIQTTQKKPPTGSSPAPSPESVATNSVPPTGPSS